MVKSIFCVFLAVHIMGDFYFQSDNIASKKRSSYKHLLTHSFIYLLVYTIGVQPFYSLKLLIVAFSFAIIHFALESILFLFTKIVKGAVHDSVMYVIEQIVHLAYFAITAIVLAYMQCVVDLLPVIKALLVHVTIDSIVVFKWVCLLLFAHKPANVTIKYLTTKYRPTDDGVGSSDGGESAGAFIGTLERIIIIILINIGQFAAIGLVLTAKSVARYNKISENKQFAEYYLAGTLLSTLYAVIIYFLVT